MTPPCSPNSRPASESAAIGLSAGGRAAAGLAVVLALAACGTRDAEPHALVTPTTSEGTSESTSVSVAPGVDSPAEAPHTSGTGVDSDRGGDGAGRDDTGDAPEYTTDLALSVKEKEAADAAVTALEEYIAVSNEVFSSGGEGAEKFENVASDAVLLETQQTAADQRDKGTVLEGEIFHVSQAVSYVDLEIADETPLPFVVIEGCVPEAAYTFSNNPEFTAASLFEYVAAKYDDQWLISEQALIGDSCS
ncbi:hypothetical protein [Brevibacterium samyangense]|uniref:Lipoprotein n=1 Tax=Brevibacterium samyangense TaxID=366888 RepID=A0ABN2TDM3_9MICO